VTVVDRVGNLHGQAGLFAGKTSSPPAGSLEDEGSRLDAAFYALWDHARVNGTDALIHAASTSVAAIVTLAATTADAAQLTVLSVSPHYDVGARVAENLATPPCVLHFIATDGSRSRPLEHRVSALMNPHVSVATVRELWDRRAAADVHLPALRAHLPLSPAVPPDILEQLASTAAPAACRHPRLPDRAREAAAADPARATLVMENPRITPEEIVAALRACEGTDNLPHARHLAAGHDRTPRAALRELAASGEGVPAAVAAARLSIGSEGQP